MFAGGEFTGSGYGLVGGIRKQNEASPELSDILAAGECLLAGLLRNDSMLVDKRGLWDVQGDPTEGALIASAAKAGLTQTDSSARYRRIDAIPFESQHQYMATLHEDKNSLQKGTASLRRVNVKGAAEVVLSRSVAMFDQRGRKAPLDAGEIHQQLESMAVNGLRVLVFAFVDLPAQVESISHSDIKELTIVGLQAMIDPPRPEVIHAIRACQSAGIQVKMITGDHALTAQAIAQQIGLSSGGGSTGAEATLVLTGRELAELTDAQLLDSAHQVAVFARVSPEQKLRLV